MLKVDTVVMRPLLCRLLEGDGASLRTFSAVYLTHKKETATSNVTNGFDVFRQKDAHHRLIHGIIASIVTIKAQS